MPDLPHLKTLTERRSFLAAARGRRCAVPGLVLQAIRRPDAGAGTDTQAAAPAHIGLGITATKKTGNAVARNRIKRRLRAAAREVLPTRAKPGYDYVLIGRVTTIDRPWQSLLDDLTLALQMVHQSRSGQKRRPPRKASGHRSAGHQAPNPKQGKS